MANIVHHLQYLMHEDEADKGEGLSFTAVPHCGRDQVKVWTTYRGYPELEKSSARIMGVAEAKKLWKELLSSGEYVHSHSYQK